jgi:hypothetical protein
MSDSMDPVKARDRSVRLVFEDGVEEIYVGLFTLMMSAIYLAYFTAPRGSSVSQILSVVSSCVPFAIVLLLVAARKRIKAAYVFPRTGYVVFRPAKWRMGLIWGLGLGAAAIGLAATIWRSLLPDLSSVAGPVAAVVMAGCLLWGGIAYKYPHLNWLAAFTMLLGGVTYVAGANGMGMLWVMLGVGMALAVSGALRFRAFLKTRPIIQTHSIGEDHHA